MLFLFPASVLVATLLEDQGEASHGAEAYGREKGRVGTWGYLYFREDDVPAFFREGPFSTPRGPAWMYAFDVPPDGQIESWYRGDADPDRPILVGRWMKVGNALVQVSPEEEEQAKHWDPHWITEQLPR